MGFQEAVSVARPVLRGQKETLASDRQEELDLQVSIIMSTEITHMHVRVCHVCNM